MALLDRIREIIEQKKTERREPSHALFFGDLIQSGYHTEELKQQLRQLARQGKIHIGNTINDFYITINSAYNENKDKQGNTPEGGR